MKRNFDPMFLKTFHSSPVPMTIATKKDGVWIDVNEAFCKAIEYTREEIIGHTSLEMNLIGSETRTEILQKLQHNEPINNIEIAAHSKSGRTIFLLTFFIDVEMEGEIYVLATMQNITERKLLEEKLRESEKRFKTFYEIAPIGISIVDKDNNVIDANLELEKILRVDREGLITGGYKDRTYLRQDGTPMPTAEFASMRAENEMCAITDVEIGVVIETGETIWTSVSAAPLNLLDDKVITITRDITDQKKTEEALQKSESLYRTLFDTAPIGITLADMNGQIIASNPSAIRILGLTVEKQEQRKIEGLEWRIIRPDGSLMPTDEYASFRALKEQKPVQDVKMGVIRGKEDIAWISVNAAPIPGTGVVITYVEYTEQKKAEDMLRSQSILLTEGQKLSHTGSWEFNLNSEETYWSEEEFHIYGLSPSVESPTYQELLQKHIHPADAKELDRVFSSALKNLSIFEMEHRILWPDGSERIVFDRAIPFCDENGTLLKYTGTTVDITDYKKVEEEIRKAQKLESLAHLAGGIAHDFNNLLGGIFGYIELAKGEPEEISDECYLEKALSTIDRARSLTGQLLTFAKGGEPMKKLDRLTPFIEETARFALSGSNVACRFTLSHDLWACNFDRNQIGQIIDNIVINAQQAMPEGGTVEMSAENIHLAEKAHSTLHDGNYVKVAIKDHGIGIPKEILPKIFDPFFTTKAKGHGLGLATSYSIIKRHGGCIEVESEPGKGSTFTFYLPASSETITADVASLPATHQGFGSILVMDDEDVMRDTVGFMLKAIGYNVHCVSNSKEAIDTFKRIRKGKDHFAAIILDLTIPGEPGGKETIREIRKIDKDIPAFVASGYANDPVMANPAEYGFNNCISKPFRKADLAKLLNEHINKSK